MREAAAPVKLKQRRKRGAPVFHKALIAVGVDSDGGESNDDLRRALAVIMPNGFEPAALRLQRGKRLDSRRRRRTRPGIGRERAYDYRRGVGIGLGTERPAAVGFLGRKQEIHASVPRGALAVRRPRPHCDERVSNARDALLLNVIQIRQRLYKIVPRGAPRVPPDGGKGYGEPRIFSGFIGIQPVPAHPVKHALDGGPVRGAVIILWGYPSAPCESENEPFASDGAERGRLARKIAHNARIGRLPVGCG